VWTLEDAIEHLSGKRPSSQCDDQYLSDCDEEDDVKSVAPLDDEPHCSSDAGWESASHSSEADDGHNHTTTPGTLPLNLS